MSARTTYDIRVRGINGKKNWRGANTHTGGQGIKAHGMIVLGQDRLDVRRERREVTLVEDRLDELFPRTRLKTVRAEEEGPTQIGRAHV